ncbi:hypothetical protein [Mastigocladopsis repens]|uniref:hypothetical protein n=1 Tax=Mastigocladopsis repens TaxID=221287 RepID=UPI000302235F|nr:hypothetical protein [Mastigocladopsis repens]
MTFSRSRFPEFFSGSNGIKMHLKFGDTPPEALPMVTLQDKGKQDIFPQQSCLIELHPVFSHMSFLLIETLSVTQHGEFITRSKKGNYETIVELGGHTSHRYHLDKKELEEIQQMYEQILENWIGWRVSRKKT